MKQSFRCLMIVLFLNYYCYGQYEDEDIHKIFSRYFKNSLIDPHILDLIDPEWFLNNLSDLNDTKCNEDIREVARAFINNEMWSHYMLDSSSKITSGVLVGHLTWMGNYNECLNFKPGKQNITGQYCLISAAFFDSEDFEKYGANGISTNFLIGQCIPSSCSREYLNHILQHLKLPSISTHPPTMWIDEGDCRQKDEILEYTTLNRITIGIFAGIGVLVVLSTFYDFYTKKEKPNELLTSFSFITNIRKLTSFKEPTYVSCLNGIKAYSIMWLIYAHVELYSTTHNVHDITTGMFFAYNNAGLAGWLLENSYFVIDSFFFISGSLVITSFFKNTEKKGEYDPVLMFIKRYLRLMMPFAGVYLIRMGISEHLGDGPVYNHINNYLKMNCSGALWRSVLLYDNYEHEPSEMCFVHSWYMYVDLQLFLFSQVLLIIASRKIRVSVLLSLLFGCASTGLEFYIASKYDLGVTPLIDRGKSVIKYDFSFTHTRASPWFFGMVMGFILLWSEKSKFVLKRREKVLGWLLWILITSATILCIAFFDLKKYNQPTAALYLSLHRVGWSVSVGWLMFTSWYNNAVLNEFLSWGFFDYIGKISYEIYLLHIPVIEYIIASAHNTEYTTVGRNVYHFFSHLWIIVILATLMTVFVSMPLKRILKYCTKNMQIAPVKCKHYKFDSKFQI